MTHILMIASENDGLHDAKVGGIADVVRDAPPALARMGCRVDVVTPSYGYLHKVDGATHVRQVPHRFRGVDDASDIYEVPGKTPVEGVRHFAIDHPSCVTFNEEHGTYQIYVHDPSDKPFASDANKFACFCMAAAEAVKEDVFGSIDCIHLHDWHAGFFQILRRYDPAYQGLRLIRTAFTIHNLALQGARPLAGEESSLEAWYPGMEYDRDELFDPRWTDCMNPMLAGIRFSDAVHAVSPSYADEICRPSREPHFFGGEGLEEDILNAKEQGRLFGILNGCEYPEGRKAQRLAFGDLLDLLDSEVRKWTAKQAEPSPAHALALERLEGLRSTYSSQDPQLLLTSVTRVTGQKALLLRAGDQQGEPALAAILRDLEAAGGVYIVLGNGESVYEEFLLDMSRQFTSFVFMNGFSNACASALYASGDLFLMPSSFEPCGISQMLAMRDGQPCLVHAVGGLKDTVKNGVNGFAFVGDTIEEQAEWFVQACRLATKVKLENPSKWKRVRTQAAKARFLWDDSVTKYVQNLYS